MNDTSDPRVLLAQALAQSEAVIASVGPEHGALATPCQEFNVRDLVGHMVFAAERAGAAGRRDVIALEPAGSVHDVDEQEWGPVFWKAAEAALEAWDEPGALEGEIALPFGTFPAPIVVAIYSLEHVTHAWDLAVAIGAAGSLDTALAEAVLPFAHQLLPPEGRGDEQLPFAAVIEVPDDASAYDRLAGFLGRQRRSDPGARPVTGERADILAALRKARQFLRHTVRDLSDEQVREHPTVSALCLGGLIKHVSKVEERWGSFIVEGTSAMSFDPAAMRERLAGFELAPGETLAGVLSEYAEVAGRTDDLVATLPDLDVTHPLPEAPWFPPGTAWSARQVLFHIVAETAQHAGHADIIRESIDGAKTMG